jgi:hypothetical protein
VKLCTKWRLENGTPAEAVDVSLVADDHQFGEADGFLHVEGMITQVTQTLNGEHGDHPA